uniref:Secreted protein n=1 Tax=Heterorhabditis bacteriophora TaxID=37862 RepID=A0A1I7XW72_HETBA
MRYGYIVFVDKSRWLVLHLLTNVNRERRTGDEVMSKSRNKHENHAASDIAGSRLVFCADIRKWNKPAHSALESACAACSPCLFRFSKATKTHQDERITNSKSEMEPC